MPSRCMHDFGTCANVDELEVRVASATSARLATLEGESVGVKKKDKGKQKSRNQRRRDARGGT